MEKREQAKKRIELARLLVEAALTKCEKLGVTVHGKSPYRNKGGHGGGSFGAQVVREDLKYHHADYS